MSTTVGTAREPLDAGALSLCHGLPRPVRDLDLKIEGGPAHARAALAQGH